MLILLQDSLPNLIGDSREEETFCVDTKHRRRDKNTGRQNLGIYCGCSKCHVLNMWTKHDESSDASDRLFSTVVC